MKTSDLIYSILKIFTITLAVLMALAVILPVFVCDQFRIGGVSMEPTLRTGDHVFVNKLLMGARIYTKYDFSDPVMESFRMPGLRRVRLGDVALSGTPDEVLEVHGVYMSRYITTGIATRILFSRDPTQAGSTGAALSAG